MSEDTATDKSLLIDKLVKIFKARRCTPELNESGVLVMHLDVTPLDHSKTKIVKELIGDLNQLFGGPHKILIAVDTSSEALAITLTCRASDSYYAGGKVHLDFFTTASALMDTFYDHITPSAIDAALASLAASGAFTKAEKPERPMDSNVFAALKKLTGLLAANKHESYLDYHCTPKAVQSPPIIPAKQPLESDEPPITPPWGRQRIIRVDKDPTDRYHPSAKVIKEAVTSMHNVVQLAASGNGADAADRAAGIRRASAAMDEALSDLKIHLEVDRDEMRRHIGRHPEFGAIVPVVEWMEQVIAAIGQLREAVKAADPAEKAINKWQAEQRAARQESTSAVPSI